MKDLSDEPSPLSYGDLIVLREKFVRCLDENKPEPRERFLIYLSRLDFKIREAEAEVEILQKIEQEQT